MTDDRNRADVSLVIDREMIRPLMDHFCRSAGIASAIIDLRGKVLVECNWQRICTEFHRPHPDCLKRCIESDTILADKLAAGEKFAIYTCRNGLTDCASPVIINGTHAANMFIGQFFVETPDLDVFRRQAADCGFDEKAYLAAVSEVPVLAQEKITTNLEFLVSFAELVGEMGMTNLAVQEKADRLEISEALWKSLVENNPDLVLTVDRSGRVLFDNKPEPGETSGDRPGPMIWDRFSPAHEEDLRLALLHVFQTGQQTRAEYAGRKIPGSPAWFLTNFIPIRIEQRVESALVIARDITLLKREEAELKSYQNRLRELVDQKTESLDKALRAALSLKEDADEQRRRAEAAIVDLTGLQSHLEDLVSERTAKLEVEIEERRKVEEELRSSESKFSLAFHSSPLALLITRAADGSILEVNQGFCRMFDYGPDNLWGRTLGDLNLMANPAVDQEILEAIRIQGSVAEAEIQFRRKSGQVFWGLLSIDVINLKGEECHLSTILDVDEQKRAAEAVRESEERFKILFEYAPDAYYLYDADGHTIDGNRKAEALMGFAREELIGRDLLELNLFSPEDRPRIVELLKKSRLGLPTGPDELTLIRESGRSVVVEMLTYPVTIGNRPVILGIARDISARKKAEQALRESRERIDFLANVLERGSQPFAVGYPDGRVGTVNKAYEQLTGYTSEELQAVSWADTLTPPEWRELERRKLEELIQTRRPVRYEKQYIRKDGTRVPLELLVHLAADSEGRAYYYTFYTDISERQRAAREREQLLDEVSLFGQRLGWALQAGPGGAWDWDLISGQTWWSPEMHELWGVPQGTPMSIESSMAIVHPDDRTRVQDLLAVAIDQRIQPKYEFRIVRPNGSERWMSTAGRVIYDDSGRAVRMIGITLDITERKTEEAELKRHRENLEKEVWIRTEDLEKSRRAALSLMQDANIQRQRAEKALEELARSEYELIMARDQAESANKAKSAFLATMSHEIRTPINSVVGLAYLALKTDLDPKQNAYLQKILHSSVSLQRIIDDTLDFSKIEAGRLDLEAVDFRLEEILEDVASIIHAKAQGKGLRFLVVTDPDVPRGLCGDPYRLRQVLLNLTDNAVKFTEAGQVTVLTKLDGLEDGQAVLRFIIKDTGIGLREHEISRLFRPFTQADATTTRKYGGTGLGLAICKRLVEMMSGEISIKSEPGRGSEFTFTARFATAQAPVRSRPERPSPAGQPTALAGARILLVEDNEINREVGRELLESEGLVVEVAENGREAVEKVKPGRYDLVLMDIQMPIMDGVEATRVLRRDKRLQDLPILAMTADVRDGGLKEYRRAGMNDSISKPINPEDLFGTLAKWVKPHGWVLSRGGTTLPAQESTAAALSLDGLAGLDVKSGLARVSGNVKLYRKLLSKFRSRYEQAASTIQKSVESKDLEQAQALSHTLKGVSGNLGAQDLSRASGDLNQALRNGSDQDVKAALAAFSPRMSAVLDSIEGLEKKAGDKPGLMPALEGSSLEPQLRRMLELVKVSDLDALDLLPGLETALAGRDPGDRLAAIGEALEHFRFEEALDLLTQTARENGIHLTDKE